MLNAQWLETFVVLCEAGHFTRAAARLNMTQPGVSQHLKKLEDQVGQALVTRDGKGFTLTPAGEAVRDLGRQRRSEERQLRDALDGDDAGKGQVSLACSGSLALLIYPRIITLMQNSPGLMVRLEAAPQARVVEGVLSGVYDIGVADHKPTNPRLDGDLLGSDELCLLLPRGQSTEPSFADLERLGFIAHPDGIAYADELLSANFPSEYQGVDSLRIRSFINQIGQIPEPVAKGVGYTILPRSGVDAYPRRADLACMALANPVRHDLWMVRRRGKVFAARTKRVVTEVIDTVRNLTGLS
ncbi:LysR family transcriptional regulator [Neorhizobium sp. NCHU2750]|uniref:LysR family transcriptional regulator n=1 Tax=Neorhizobium sp. NCHU2750 TaxID=1825976 RepID=UPI000E714F27|nr:LysR family transcriptional regulator [Neorhizobium sp. NCHU2750]